jgi:DNA-dependent metalloprotease WSS1
MAVAGNNTVPSAELADLPVCGGTFSFRSRAKKRKRASGQENLTWKEKRDKRIEKKFGKNGQTLGEDAETRLMLKIGSRGNVGGKPRVAQSKRGRELRAAAALARFGTNKAEVDHLKAEDDEGDESEDEYEDVDGEQEDAKDADGRRILDGSGHGVLRVCRAEDGTDIHFKQEMCRITYPLGSICHSREIYLCVKE